MYTCRPFGEALVDALSCFLRDVVRLVCGYAVYNVIKAGARAKSLYYFGGFDELQSRGQFAGQGYGLAVSPYDGTIWASDGERVQICSGEQHAYDEKGYVKNPQAIRMLDQPKFHMGGSLRPVSIAFDNNGEVFIAMREHNAVCVYDTAGHFRRWIDIQVQREKSWDSAETSQFSLPLNKPRGVAVNGEGLVAVADTLNGRVVIFTREGKFVKAFDRERVRCGPGPGRTCFSNPRSLAVTPTNELLVLDSRQLFIQVCVCLLFVCLHLILLCSCLCRHLISAEISFVRSICQLQSRVTARVTSQNRCVLRVTLWETSI